MKTNAILNTVILIAGVVLGMAVQWRVDLRLRQENQELGGVRDKAEQARTDLEQVTKVSTEREAEAQSLRSEVSSLQTKLQTVQLKLEQATNAANEALLAAERSLSRIGNAPASASRVSLQSPSASKSIPHLRPKALSNLPVSSPDDRYVFRTGGRLDGITLYNGITEETVLAGPAWLPSQPLPLSFINAEEIARAELNRLVDNEPSWKLRTIELIQLWNNPQAWHYSLRFDSPDKATLPPDNFAVNVGFSGALGTTKLANRQ